MNFHPRIGTCASDLTVDKSMQPTAMGNYLLSWRDNKFLDNNKLITLPHRNNCKCAEGFTNVVSKKVRLFLNAFKHMYTALSAQSVCFDTVCIDLLLKSLRMETAS